jgi:hypothetical protein
MQENLTTKKRGNPRRYYAMQFYDWLESVKDPDLPDDFVCPICGVGKDQFELQE